MEGVKVRKRRKRVCTLAYADDIVLIATEGEMRSMLDRLEGQTILVGKDWC